MKLEQIQKSLNDSSFSISRCSRVTGIHINTLYRIANGKAKQPHPRTLEAIQQYIEQE